MLWKSTQRNEYELTPTRESITEDDDYSPPSFDSQDDADADAEPESHLLTGENVAASRWSRAYLLFRSLAFQPLRGRRTRRRSKRRRGLSGLIFARRSAFRNFALLSYAFLALITAIAITCATFFPSYANPPAHYTELRNRVRSSTIPGRGNPKQEKIYIAASIYDKDGGLARGAWGSGILDLIDLLGPENVYLSIYENDSGPQAREALEYFEQRVPCNHTLIFEEHLSLESMRHVTLPDGSKRVKRIEYLSEVRNRALRPLDRSDTRFDKLLFLNDVVFYAEDILQLIFSTNIDESGTATYRAACAVDFINPFKFYDTLATRDTEGYRMGVPFFPWFSSSGEARSRRAIMEGVEAVPVRSCWGGIVAFDAKFFQSGTQVSEDTAGARSPVKLTTPFRFRAERELFWDASECCLIQADIQSTDPSSSGIFMNPFVRVAYDSYTLSWLGFTRRFEKLYSPIQFLIDVLVNLPPYNPRRDEKTWQLADESVWVPDAALPFGGSFQILTREATHSGFCGYRDMPVIKDHLREGEVNYEKVPIPPDA